MYTRGTAQARRFGEKVREARLMWFGHLLIKDAGYIGRKMLTMELPEKRKWGRPKMRYIDAVREGMAAVEVMEEDTEERTEWRRRIR